MERIRRLVSWVLTRKDGQQLLAVSLFINVVMWMNLAALSGRNEALHKTIEMIEQKYQHELKEANDKLKDSYIRNNEFLRQSTFDAQRMKDSLYIANLRTENLQRQLKRKR